MFKKAVKSLVFLLGIVICVVPSRSWAGGWGDPNFIDFDTSAIGGYSNADIPSFDLDLDATKVETVVLDSGVTKVETETGLPYLPIIDDDRQDVEVAPVKNAVGISASVSDFLESIEDIKEELKWSWGMACQNYDRAVPLVEKAYNLEEELHKKVDSKNTEFLEGKKQLGRILKSLGDNRRDFKGDFSKAIGWYEKASSLTSSGYERGKIDIDIMRCYQALAKEAEENGQFEDARDFHNRIVTKYEFSVKGSLIILDKSKSDIPKAYRDESTYDAYYIRENELKGDANFALGQSMYYLGAYAKGLEAFTEVEKILNDSEHTHYTPLSYKKYEINLFKCLCYDKLGKKDEAFAELKKISDALGLNKEAEDVWKGRIEDRFYRETDIAAIGKYVNKYRWACVMGDENLIRSIKGYED